MRPDAKLLVIATEELTEVIVDTLTAEQERQIREIVKPKPRFEVGQWVELTCAKEPNTIAVIRRIDDEADMASVILMDGDQDIIPLYELTPIPAKEVILDFGAFSGTIAKTINMDGTICEDSFIVFYDPDNLDTYDEVELDSVPAMRSLVESLLARQEEER